MDWEQIAAGQAAIIEGLSQLLNEVIVELAQHEDVEREIKRMDQCSLSKKL